MYKQKKLRRIDRCFCFGEMNFLSGCIECMKFMLIVICINAWILTLHIFSLTSYKSRNDLGENWYFRKWILYYSLNKISVLRQSLDFLMYNFFFIYESVCLAVGKKCTNQYLSRMFFGRIVRISTHLNRWHIWATFNELASFDIQTILFSPLNFYIVIELRWLNFAVINTWKQRCGSFVSEGGG